MQHNVCMRNNEFYDEYIPIKTHTYNNDDIVNLSKNDLLTTNTNNTNTYTLNNTNNTQIYPKHILSNSKNNNFKNSHYTHNNKTLQNNSKKVQSRETKLNNKKSLNNNNKNNKTIILKPTIYSILTPQYFNNLNAYISSNNINNELHTNNDIDFNDDNAHNIDLDNILDEYKILFDTDLSTFINVDPINLKIKNNSYFKKSYPRVMAPLKREFINKKVESLLEAKIISKVTSGSNICAYPVVVATHPRTKKLRMCIDFVELNKLTEDFDFPIPNIKEV